VYYSSPTIAAKKRTNKYLTTPDNVIKRREGKGNPHADESGTKGNGNLFYLRFSNVDFLF